MLPQRFAGIEQRLPELAQATSWQLLRQWSLSEVYRVTLNGGHTCIVKWSGGDMAREASIYSDLLIPLQVRTPKLYFLENDSRQGFIVMEDAGTDNLEQQPEPAHFLEAAGELARLRTIASVNLARGSVSRDVMRFYTATASDFLGQLDHLLHIQGCSEYPLLLRAKRLLSVRIDNLYRDEPLSIVHHDYHAKTLVVHHNRVLPVDWSNAYLSPHLGDLYSLTTEAAGFCGMSPESIREAFMEQYAQSGSSVSEIGRLTAVGGLCWLIRSLHWLTTGGSETIPGSESWVSDLIADMEPLCDELS